MGAAEVIATLRADTSEFMAKIGEADAEVHKLSDSGSTNFSKFATVGKFAAAAVGGALVAVGVASVDLADKYQEATNSIAANGNISVASADKIGKAFLGTAGTTVYSAQTIAGAFGAVAGQVKAMNGGVLDAKAAMEVMKPAMDLAEASGESLNSTTKDITTTLQAFGLGIKNSPLVSNVLFNAARVTGTSVDTLSGTIDKARAKMGAAAPSVQQMGGLIVDLAQHGETGRAAMSALGSAFTGIITPTAAVTKAQQAMGLSFINAKGQLDPLQDIIASVAPKIEGMGNAQATAVLKSLGFGAASTKLLGVIQAGPAAFDKATAAVGRTNSAHEAAEKQAQTMSHQIEVLKAGIEDEGVKLGQALIPKLEDLVKIVMKVVDWLGKHKGIAEALAIVVGGVLVAAIAAYTVSMISAAAATLAAAAPILAIIAVVALLAAGVYEVITHWHDIEDFFKGLWHDVEGIFDDAVKFVVGIIKGWWPLILGIMTGGIALLPALLIKYWSQIKSDVVTYWNDIVNFFSTLPAKILAFFSGALSWLAGVGHDIITGLWNGVKDEWNAIGDVGATIKGWLTTAASDAIHWLEQAGEDIIQGLINGLGNAEHFVVDKIKSIGSDIVNGFKSILGIGSPSRVFYQHGLDVIQGLTNGMIAASGGPVAAIAGVAANLSIPFGSINPSGGTVIPNPLGQNGAGGGGALTASVPVQVVLNGQVLGSALQTVVLQAQRGQSQPFFGTTQSAA